MITFKAATHRNRSSFNTFAGTALIRWAIITLKKWWQSVASRLIIVHWFDGLFTTHRSWKTPSIKRKNDQVIAGEWTKPFLLNPAKVAGKSGIEHHVKEENPRNIKEVEEFRFCLLEIEMRLLQILCLVISRKKLSTIVFDHLCQKKCYCVVMAVPLFLTFAEKEGIPHKRITSSDNEYVIDDIFHIQNLNVYTIRLKTWMKRFNGVATKYLANYLAWRRILEKQKGNISSEICFSQSLGSMN